MEQSTPKTFVGYKKIYILALALLSNLCFTFEQQQEFFDLDPSQPQNSQIGSKTKQIEQIDEWVALPQKLDSPGQFIEQINAHKTQDYISSKGLKYKVDLSK